MCGFLYSDENLYFIHEINMPEIVNLFLDYIILLRDHEDKINETMH